MIDKQLAWLAPARVWLAPARAWATIAGLTIFVVQAVVDREWLVLAIGAALVVIGIRSTVGAVLGLLVAIYLGEPWLVVTLAVLLAHLVIVPPLPLRVLRAGPDPRALAGVAAQVSPAVTRLLTAVSEHGPVSSISLVRVAAAERPPAWRSLSLTDAEQRWDGAVLPVAGRSWTTFAAESVALARLLAREAENVTEAQLLGAAALLIPESAARKANAAGAAAGPIASAVTGLSVERLTELVQELAGTRAGAGVLRRVEMRRRIDPNDELDQEMLFAGGWRIAVAAALRTAPGPVLVVAFIGSMLGTAWRWLGGRSNTPAEPADVPAADQPPPGRMGALLRNAAAGTSGPAAVLLRVVRPACTLGAVVLVAFAALPWWVKIVAGVLLVLVRPLRRWWLDAGWIAALAALSLAGGPLLAVAAGLTGVRLVSTWLAVRRWGFAAAVVEPRRRLPAIWQMDPDQLIPTPERAWARFLDEVRAGDDEPFWGTAEYVVAGWATGDAAVQARVVTRALRKELLGQYPADAVRPSSLVSYVVRHQAIEVLTGPVARWLVAVLTAAVTALVVPVPAFGWGSVHLPGWALSAVTAFLLVQSAALGISKFWIVVTAVPIVLLSGTAAIPTLAVAVVAGAAAWSLRRYAERRVLIAPPRISTASLTVTGFRFRLRYRVAASFAARNRPGIAVDLLAELAEECRGRRPSLAAIALAELALVELERGRLQPAVEAVTEAATIATGDRATSFVHYAQGVIWCRVGDYGLAIPSLRAAEPALRGTAEGMACAAALAQALAATGSVDEAIGYLARASMRPTGQGRLMALAESQVATGWALLREGRPDEAYAAVEDIGPGSGEEEDEEPGTERAGVLWLRLVGEVMLIKGQAALAGGRLPAAAEALAVAVEHLPSTTAAGLLGMARIAQGHYHSLRREWQQACDSVRIGTRLLERRRGQLRLGVHRGGLLNADRAAYDTALGVLAKAQLAGRAEAGEIASTLLESLRRDSFALLLRDSRSVFFDRLPAAAQELVAGVAALDAGLEVDVKTQEGIRNLRADLAGAVSQGFADAYLPQDVDLAAVLPTVRGAHVLQYEFVEVTAERWRGYRTWIPPCGRPVVDEVIIADPGALEILADSTPENVGGFSITTVHVADDWAALAAAVLPTALRAELALVDERAPVRLVVCAGEHLAYLPWPALLLDAEDPDAVLLRKAVLQFVPSLSVIGEPAGREPGGDVLAYIDRVSPDGPLQQRRLTDALSVVFTDSRAAFEKQLTDRRFAGAYLTAHGAGAGMAQGVKFSDGGVLSAAAALRYRWPPWMVFASCFVAKLEQQAGHEPFGLVGACMLGGCRSVIGGVISVEQSATSVIATEVAIAVAGGADPAAALRHAQLGRLEARGGAAFIDQWAGLICFATSAHPG
jgi:tetratricopeptide (TPR) repeat protein